MIRRACVLTAALLLAIGAPAVADAQGVEGNWKFNIVANGTFEQTLAIVGLKTEGGKTTGEIVAGFGNPTIKSVTREGNLLRVVVQRAGVEFAFEGIVPKEAGKALMGSVSINDTLYPGSLNSTEDTTLDQKNSSRALFCPPLQQARSLTGKVAQLKQRALTEKDPEKKTDLLKQYEEALAEANTKVPKLYREVLENHADSPVIFDAGMTLIRSAKKYDPKAFDMKALAKTLADAAKAYGPRWQADIDIQLASALIGQDGQAALALHYAKVAEKDLNEKAPAGDQVRVLSIVAKALRKNSMAEEADKIELRVTKLDEILDREYVKKMPGFEGTAFEGAKARASGPSSWNCSPAPPARHASPPIWPLMSWKKPTSRPNSC